MDLRNSKHDLEVISVRDYLDDVYEKKHHLEYGCTTIYMDDELISRIKDGEVIAFNDGEYCNFIISSATKISNEKNH